MNPWKWWKNLKRRHKWLGFFTVVWGASLIVAHTQLFYRIEIPGIEKGFAESFWPNFLSDIGASILLVWLLGDLLEIARRADYDLQIEVERVETGQPDRFEMPIKFFLINAGRESFKRDEIKYHVYVEDGLVGGYPAHLTPEQVGLQEPFRPGRLDPTYKSYLYYKGNIDEAIYPGEKIEIKSLGTFNLRRKEEEYTIIYYYFSTEYGLISPSDRYEKDVISGSGDWGTRIRRQMGSTFVSLAKKYPE